MQAAGRHIPSRRLYCDRGQVETLSRYFVPLRNETKELRLPTCHIQDSTAVRQAETIDELLGFGQAHRVHERVVGVRDAKVLPHIHFHGRFLSS